MAEGAVQIAQKSGRREQAGLFEAGTAVWEAFHGNAAAARQSAARALQLGRGRDVDYAAAFALALSGDLAQSRVLAQDLARQFPEDTFVQFMYLPTLRALFALNTHDAAAAIQALQTASRYDLALGGVGFIGRFGGLYPIYVRGVAYLAARQPPKRLANSRGFSIIEASCSPIPWTPWRACSWRERSCSRAKPRRRKSPTTTSSRCGKMPTLRSRSLTKHERNTQNYSEPGSLIFSRQTTLAVVPN